jgi:outer membrane autotransporter protein
VNYGTVSPGTDTTIDTLTVTGETYRNTALGRYLYNGDNTVIGPDPTKDICSGDLMDIVDGGTATLAGTLEFVPTEQITTSRTYETIKAEGGITGLFDTLTESDPDVRRLRQRVVNSVPTHLLRAVNVDYSSVSSIANIMNVGSVIEGQADAVYNTGSDKDVVLTALDWLDPETEAADALAQLLPYTYSAHAEVSMNLQRTFADIVSGQMFDFRRALAQTGASDNPTPISVSLPPLSVVPAVAEGGPVFFVKGIGTWGDSDSEQSRALPGYDYNSYGFLLGVDWLANDNLILGFGAGEMSTNVDYARHGSSSDVTSAKAMAYGSWFKDDFHVDGLLGYGRDWYDSKRHIEFDTLSRTAEADYSADIYTLRLDGGYVFRPAGFETEPFLGVHYSSYEGESFTEEGSDSTDLHVHSQDYDSLRSRMGLRVARSFDMRGPVRLVPEASLAWEHEFMDSRYDLGSDLWGTHFPTDGYDVDQNHFLAKAGLSMAIGKNVSVLAGYSADFSGGFGSDSVNVGVSVRW